MATGTADPTPPALEIPKASGCPLHTTDFYELRFRHGSPPFATLRGVHATVDMAAVGPAGGAVALASRGGFTLHGIIAADDLRLFPAHAIVLGGFLSPAPTSRLTWRGSAPGTVIVGSTPPDRIEPLAGGALDATRLRCSDIALAPATFDPRSAAPHAPQEQQGYLAAGAIVSLSREHDTEPIARLHISKDADAQVSVMQARGKRSFVRWERPEAVVFGWVPTSRLGQAPSVIGDSFGNADMAVDGAPQVNITAVVQCPRDVPLVAEVHGERRTIGNIAAGTLVPLTGPQRPLLSVALPGGLAMAAPDARVGVLASHLGACTAHR